LYTFVVIHSEDGTSVPKHVAVYVCHVYDIKKCILWIIQGEHKFFPLLQTFITRKLRGIQTGAYVEVY